VTEAPRFFYDDSMEWFEVETSRASEVLQYVPGSAIVGAGEDGPVLRVPWDTHSCEVMAQLRVAHLPPMLRDYNWPGKFTPMPHQMRIAGALSTHRRFFCLADLGVGKTISSLWAADWLMEQGLVKQVLIVAPLSIMRTAWQKELNTHLPHRSVTVLYHSDPLVRRRKATSLADFHIVNYSGIEIVYEEAMLNNYDLIIIDEMTAYKKHGTRRWKFIRPLVERAERVWALTGTPSVQYPLDAYGQVKLMFQDWDMTETRFKLMTMVQHSKYRWVPLDNATETVREVIQPAMTIKKRDVLLDLPPMTFSTREVNLSVEQKRLMKELRREAQVQSACGAQISAVHAASLRTKLLQIASGVVYDDQQVPIDIDCKERVAELLDIVAQVRSGDDGQGPPSHKVLICCQFVHTVGRVHAELQKAGFNFAVMHGGVPLKQRERIIDSMQTTREYDGIVCQPEVMSHGITLTSATATVFWTPLDKAEVALQVQGRTDRPGQRFPTQIIRVCGCAAEALLYERLDMRIDFHHELIKQYGEFVEAL
jgi:SNF2 family DNA or RNA helicase